MFSRCELDHMITIYKNNGSQSFNSTYSVSNSASTSSGANLPIHADYGDMDNDGDYDVVSASLNDGRIAWFNNSNYSFSRMTTATEFDGARSVDAVDFDRDGDIDVVAVGQEANTINIWKNRNAQFYKNTVSNNINNVYFAIADDLDLDGDFDIIAVSGDDNKIVWFESATDFTAPIISSVSLAADNSTLSVTISEAVYNSSSGSGSLEASDFAFSISGGLATLSSATPTSISASGNVYTLGIGLSGTPTGGETLTVVPVANSIYDGWANVASTSQSNNIKSLNDKKSMFTVKKDGSGDLSTIQAAINAASAGDTILVHDGTYTENINYGGKDIVVVSNNGPNVTILSPSDNSQPIVYFNNSETDDAA